MKRTGTKSCHTGHREILITDIKPIMRGENYFFSTVRKDLEAVK